MNGILIIDKPAGLTSHDAVMRVRRALRVRRVGHTGTLDPLATGVLVILVGQATRLAQFLAGAVKEYEAIIRLGFATETGDLAGAEIAATRRRVDCATWSDAEIAAALASLRGPSDQTPPMYSAKKVRGRKLYELARRGIEVERAPARVMVYELEARRREGALLHPGPDGTCDLAVRVVCSAGTYVRALAERLGERLGTGAHLASLRRTRAGDFHLADAVSLARLETMAAAGQAATLLLPLGAALSAMPFLHLNADEARQAQHGAALHPPPVSVEWKDGDHVKLCDGDGRLIAVGVYDCERRLLRPRIVFGP